MYRTGRVLAHFFTLLLSTAAILSAVVVVLLARGPLSLGFASVYIAKAFNEEDAALKIGFSDTVLTWNRADGRLDFRVVDVQVKGKDGAVVASVPEIAFDLDGRALLRGRIEPVNLSLIAPRVWLVREKNGTFEFGLGAGDDDLPERAEAGLMAAWRRDEWPDFMRALASIAIVDADLTIFDVGSGKFWRAPQSDLAMRRTELGLTLTLNTRLALEQNQASIVVTALHGGADTSTEVDINFRDLVPAAVAREIDFEALQALAPLDLPVEGRFSFNVTREGAVERLYFDLKGGAGAVVLPDLFDRPLPVAALTAKGGLGNDGRILTVDRAHVDFGGGATASFEGVLTGARGNGLAIKGQGRLGGLTVADVAKFWPPGLEPKARSWVVERVRKGNLPRLDYVVDVRPEDLQDGADLRPEMIVLEFDLQGGEANFWDKMPVLRDVYGRGRLDAGNFQLTFDRARLEDVKIGEGRVTIADFSAKTQTAKIEFLATGPTASILRILDREPLRLSAGLGLDTSQTAGEGAVRTRLTVPLERDLKSTDVGYAASATLTGFALPNVFGLYPLSAGELTLKIAPEGMQVAGTAALAGAPVSIDWRHDFVGADEAPDRYGLALRLNAAHRRALGFPLDDYVTGDVTLELRMRKGRNGVFGAQGQADLTTTGLVVSELGWQKPKGVPARAEFAFRGAPDQGLEVERFRLTGDGVEAAGTARFVGAENRIALDHARFGANDLSADITWTEDAPLQVTVTGARLDLRPVLAARAPAAGLPANGSAARKSTLSAAFDTVILSDDYRLTALTAKGVRQGRGWRELSGAGKLNDGAPVRFRVNGTGGTGQRLAITSEDAGAVVAQLGLTDGVRGGKFRLDMDVPGGLESASATKGRLRIGDFKVMQAPVLTRVLTLGSITGISDLLKGEGIAFRGLDARFAIVDNVIQVRDLRAVGAALGVTMAGDIDREEDRLSLEGTVVPAYSLNSVLGEIPLLGTLLVGRKGEGVFAVSYRIDGRASAPVVRVNPLSALAPGFLRRILEVLDQPADAIEDADGHTVGESDAGN